MIYFFWLPKQIGFNNGDCKELDMVGRDYQMGILDLVVMGRFIS